MQPVAGKSGYSRHWSWGVAILKNSVNDDAAGLADFD